MKVFFYLGLLYLGIGTVRVLGLLGKELPIETGMFFLIGGVILLCLNPHHRQ